MPFFQELLYTSKSIVKCLCCGLSYRHWLPTWALVFSLWYEASFHVDLHVLCLVM